MYPADIHPARSCATAYSISSHIHLDVAVTRSYTTKSLTCVHDTTFARKPNFSSTAIQNRARGYTSLPQACSPAAGDTSHAPSHTPRCQLYTQDTRVSLRSSPSCHRPKIASRHTPSSPQIHIAPAVMRLTSKRDISTSAALYSSRRFE